MIKTVNKEEALDCPLVAITSYPSHFDGYIRYVLEDMNIDIVYLDLGIHGYRSKGCPTDINGHYVDGAFYTKYTGTLLFFHAFDCDHVAKNYPNRSFKTLLLDHRVQPFGDRATSPYNADTIICSGSDVLIRDIRHTAPFGGEVKNVGFFTTHYASPARKSKTAFVQSVGTSRCLGYEKKDGGGYDYDKPVWDHNPYRCPFDMPEVCKILLDEGYIKKFDFYEKGIKLCDYQAISDFFPAESKPEGGMENISMGRKNLPGEYGKNFHR